MGTNFAARVLAMVLVVGTSSCATTGFQTFKSCTSDVIEAAGRSLVADLATIFALGNYQAEIAKLALQVAPAELSCAVDLLIASLESHKSINPAGSMALMNAKAWRAAH